MERQDYPLFAKAGEGYNDGLPSRISRDLILRKI